MNLPSAPDKYDQRNESAMRETLKLTDQKNRKRQADLEIAGKERLILSSPDGTRFSITVDNAGTLAATAL